METFLAIVKAKNISKAANSLFVSQATVSQRLKSLEEEIGFPLLERGKGIRAVKLTQQGEEFITVAYKWIDLFRDIQSINQTSLTLPLAIGYTESMNIHLFSPFYKSLIKGEKGKIFDLTLRTERSTEIHKMVENRDLDVGFVYSLHPNDNILKTPFFFESLYVIKLFNGLAKHKTELNPSELNPHQEIYTKWSDDFQAWHQNYWNPSIKPYMTLDSEYTIVDYLDAEELWAIVPSSVAVLSKKSNPEIQIFKLLKNPPARICYKITHNLPRESRRETLALFSDLMLEFISSSTDLSPID